MQHPKVNFYFPVKNRNTDIIIFLSVFLEETAIIQVRQDIPVHHQEMLGQIIDQR